MSLKFYISFFIAFSFFTYSFGQNTASLDSIEHAEREKYALGIKNELEKLPGLSVLKEEHSPRKATFYSAILPGLGQAYNKRYWKIPIIYAGMGSIVYFIKWNDDRYQLYRRGLFAEIDGDPATQKPPGLERFNERTLRRAADFYRRNKELNMVLLALVYALNIVDAHIDAHLIGFDLTDDLSLQVKPHLGPMDNFGNNYNAGLSLSLKIKK